MSKVPYFLLGLIAAFWFFTLGAYGDETDLFSVSAKVDALIILDLSGSMQNAPDGHLCFTPGCSKLDMAKNAIYNILNDYPDGTINARDETSLGVRIGYMKYKCIRTDNLNTCISLEKQIGTPYDQIWNSLRNENVRILGTTPLVSALEKAKTVLDAHKAADPYRNCCNKFVILLTDGEETMYCNPTGDLHPLYDHKRRKAVATKAKALADAGYKVFVVGFGENMPAVMKNTLNWAAYYGGTDNPAAPNSGNPSAISIVSNPCSDTSTSNDPGYASLSGYAFLASNASDLSNALKQAFTVIREASYSFSVPSVASSRVMDGSSNENFFYEASFTPVQNDSFWQSYLKKYNINSDGTIGSVAAEAGSVLQLRTAESRRIYTYKSGALTAFTTLNLTPGDLGVGDTVSRNKVVGYVRGDPVYNPDNWKLGDTFHSNPITIGSPSLYFNDPRDSNGSFNNFRNTHSRTSDNGTRILVTGSNDGQLHAFKTSDLSEQWSFIPPNLLPKLKDLAHADHSQVQNHQYFVDGPITVADVWLGAATEDGTSKSIAEWKTLLVLGEGRGIRDSSNVPSYLWSASPSCDLDYFKKYNSSHPYYCGYYALDVTDTSADHPAFMWRLNPDVNQAKYLDEPWSKMAIGKVIIEGKEKWVGFIGGGYNTQGSYDDDDDYTRWRRGKGFFVVDLSNGNILWSYTKENNSDMDYSIPASPKIVDTDNDGFIDTAYIGDLGGNVWRFTFCTNLDGSSCNISNWHGGLLFRSSGGNHPIYTTPSVARGSFWVFWGTGDKLRPTEANTQEAFLAIKDEHRSGTYTINNLQPIGNGTYSDASLAGWYISLGSGGEKVLSDPTVFGGVAFFTTYTPAFGGNVCDTTGTGKLYGIAMMPLAANGQIFNPGDGVLTNDKERSIVLGKGIPGPPILSQKPGNGPTDLYISVSGGGGQDSTIVSIQQPGMVESDAPIKTILAAGKSTTVIHWRDMRVQ